MKILQSRKDLGIKMISAPNMDDAEVFLLNLLSDFFKLPVALFYKYYLVKNESERRLKLKLNNGISLSLYLKKN